MGDNSLLKQAHYSVVTNFTGLSSDIQLPIEIQQLSSKVIPIQSITKELEVSLLKSTLNKLLFCVEQ